jgi:hypothetical protein
MQGTHLFVFGELFLDGTDFLLEVTFHTFGIGLTQSPPRSSRTARPSALFAHLHPHPKDTRSHMFDRSKFDLEFGLRTLCMFVKDFENQINFIPCLDLVFGFYDGRMSADSFVDLIDL